MKTLRDRPLKRFLPLAAACGAAIIMAIVWSSITILYEDIALFVAPTGERALAFADKHFSSSDKVDYDINRAQMLYERAALLDPSLRTVNHQLARLDFLRGDYARALARIDIQIDQHGDTVPNSYYIRGLIEGYMGRYGDAAVDFDRYLDFDPNNWAAMNDLAWVLLKDNRPDEALITIEKGIWIYPDNPWLLNSYATALYELGRYDDALEAVMHANQSVAQISEQQWLTAYPGNDPRIAQIGMRTFKDAIETNMHMIQDAASATGVQSTHVLYGYE